MELEGKPLPAELAVLYLSLCEAEKGVWMNSRSTRVTDLIRDKQTGKFKTVRAQLPGFVSKVLESFYARPEIKRGVFDLVIWNEERQTARFVEVKCPHWDRLTPEQAVFVDIAEEMGTETSVVEWEFDI